MNISSEDVMKFLMFVSTGFLAVCKLYVSELKENSKKDKERIEEQENIIKELREENKQLHFKILEEVKERIKED